MVEAKPPACQFPQHKAHWSSRGSSSHVDGKTAPRGDGGTSDGCKRARKRERQKAATHSCKFGVLLHLELHLTAILRRSCVRSRRERCWTGEAQVSGRWAVSRQACPRHATRTWSFILMFSCSPSNFGFSSSAMLLPTTLWSARVGQGPPRGLTATSARQRGQASLTSRLMPKSHMSIGCLRSAGKCGGLEARECGVGPRRCWRNWSPPQSRATPASPVASPCSAGHGPASKSADLRD